MSDKIYLKACLPSNNQRILVNNIDMKTKFKDLRDERFRQILGNPSGRLVFCFEGRPLEDGKSLVEAGAQSGCTIHVLAAKEQPPMAASEPKLNIEEAKKILASYARLTRPEILKVLFKEYPEFYKDLGAYCLISDPVLVSSLQNAAYIDNMIRKYPILLEMAPLAKEMLSELPPHSPMSINSDDSLSDSAGSDYELSSPSRPFISREQFLAAMQVAREASLNQVANSVQGASGGEPIATTSSSATIGLAIPTEDAAIEQNEERPTEPYEEHFLFPQNDEFEQSISRRPPIINDTLTLEGDRDATVEYADQLRMMLEMGFSNEAANLQALILVEGQLEAAILIVSMR